MSVIEMTNDKSAIAHADKILPILIYIQTHLEADLSLDILAERVNLSPFHFHRLFQTAVGETLKQYTQRLRLERAAFELKLREASVLDVALSVGFQAHETFSRAFKRHFGLAPKTFRQRNARPPSAKTNEKLRQSLNIFTAAYQLSAVRVQKLQPIPLAFIRHLGPYLEADMTAFERLTVWAKRRGVYDGRNLLMGIGHDDPNITPLDKVRFDACLEVDGEFAAEGDIGFQHSPAGLFASATYIGPYGPPLESAYADIFHQIMVLEGYRLIGLPALEIYRTTHINPDYKLNETDIYLPIEQVKEI